MTSPNRKMTWIGIKIETIMDEVEDEESRQWYDEQMAPYEADRSYYICYPCLLSSLDVKPKGGTG